MERFYSEGKFILLFVTIIEALVMYVVADFIHSNSFYNSADWVIASSPIISLFNILIVNKILKD